MPLNRLSHNFIHKQERIFVNWLIWSRVTGNTDKDAIEEQSFLLCYVSLKSNLFNRRHCRLLLDPRHSAWLQCFIYSTNIKCLFLNSRQEPKIKFKMIPVVDSAERGWAKFSHCRLSNMNPVHQVACIAAFQKRGRTECIRLKIN
jgi:hypothetical protein